MLRSGDSPQKRILLSTQRDVYNAFLINDIYFEHQLYVQIYIINILINN